VARWR